MEIRDFGAMRIRSVGVVGNRIYTDKTRLRGFNIHYLLGDRNLKGDKDNFGLICDRYLARGGGWKGRLETASTQSKPAYAG